jgi:predicted nucleotidyltransferase
MVIEAGYLAGVAARRGDVQTTSDLDVAAEPVLAALDTGLLASAQGAERIPSLDTLAAILEPHWERHLSLPAVSA